MYYRGHFVLKEGVQTKRGEYCLVRSPRGVEVGKILSDMIDYDGEVVWLKNSKTHGEISGGSGKQLCVSGDVLRIATEEDLDKVQSRFARGQSEEETFCKERIKANNLSMKLAGVEFLFDGEKIIFYFLAEGRVDFRRLVKDLAKEYRTRIEMKQIGVRDEARLLAEYEHCGRRLCCKGFLNNLEPVTMKMAKSQKTTLDPSKISGRCGRLMCCLRYEDEVYKNLKEKLPRRGTVLRLESGKAKVLSSDIFLQKILVELESGIQQEITAEEMVSGSRDNEDSKDMQSKDSSRPSRSKRPPRSKKSSRSKRSSRSNKTPNSSKKSELREGGAEKSAMKRKSKKPKHK